MHQLQPLSSPISCIASRRVASGSELRPCANRLVIMNGSRKPGTWAAICSGRNVLPYSLRQRKKSSRIHSAGRCGGSMRDIAGYLLIRIHDRGPQKVTLEGAAPSAPERRGGGRDAGAEGERFPVSACGAKSAGACREPGAG